MRGKAAGRPALVEGRDGAAAFALGGGKAHGRAAHGDAGGYGDAALLVVVDGAVEMIHHAVVLHHVALVGKQLVVGLGGDDEVGTVPVLPVDEVARDGEGVVGGILSGGVVGREIEHDVESLPPAPSQRGGVHAHYLGIAGDGAVAVVGEDGIAAVASPVLHVVGEGDADALALGVGAVLATGIVEHEEAVLLQFGR